jgi:hypothetical protein
MNEMQIGRRILLTLAAMMGRSESRDLRDMIDDQGLCEWKLLLTGEIEVPKAWE